ncbi:hypothetical protein FOPG_08872 [Fusarium oxysporum f. sp. conglutinans race 2 54008]|uniref:Uncharacterized protein n=1 Tax=Fusarium oxysporum f. sp. conglutinans race 2 54008 TaxID=1089457 RepID=X0HJ35_FUSOX|nr:hypothetical protein FOPG_08872 [Fusarium oxysporum f. sp. conglutinans race 2 54008]KAI8406985.1 hypothetical protein FOFC_12414 [Fusarium oxysporum]KAK2690398.1 hypothetical protein QWA68_011284 [Fusarium oxysporum]
MASSSTRGIDSTTRERTEGQLAEFTSAGLRKSYQFPQAMTSGYQNYPIRKASLGPMTSRFAQLQDVSTVSVH